MMHHTGCGAQLAWKCPFSRRAILTHKLGQTDLVLARDQGLLVGPCMQDYKSLCAAVMICSSLVNIQTHTHSIWPAYLIISASWANNTNKTTKYTPHTGWNKTENKINARVIKQNQKYRNSGVGHTLYFRKVGTYAAKFGPPLDPYSVHHSSLDE